MDIGNNQLLGLPITHDTKLKKDALYTPISPELELICSVI